MPRSGVQTYLVLIGVTLTLALATEASLDSGILSAAFVKYPLRGYDFSGCNGLVSSMKMRLQKF